MRELASKGSGVLLVKQHIQIFAPFLVQQATEGEPNSVNKGGSRVG
jgi:hypothetical protein